MLGLWGFSPASCCVSRSVMSGSLQAHGLEPTRFLCPWNSPDKNTGAGCHALLQGIFQTQGSNPGLWHCRQILYPLSYTGNMKGFHDPLLRFNNLLEQLTELRKTLYHYYWLYYKRYNSGIAKWKRCIKQNTGEGGKETSYSLGQAILPAMTCAHQPRGLLYPVVRDL